MLQPPGSIQAGDEGMESSSARSTWGAGPEPPCAGLIPQRGQQGRGDSAPLPCSGETPPAELPPAQGSQHRKELELLEPGQRRHQDDQRGGAALLGGKAVRAGGVHLDKAQGGTLDKGLE